MQDQPRPYRTSRASQSVPRTILLVEDEPFVREATRNILESAGFEVLPAEDASAALKVYEEAKGTINLVMTDMVLPGRTGEQLGEDLRQRSPNLKVLITSGYSNTEYALNDRRNRRSFPGQAILEERPGTED